MSSLISENNKRIAKNTLALYFRQAVTMIVALFTSRIVLQALGITDYGINNVVGGVVAMLGFLSNTLMLITQRFISVELGKGGDPVVLQEIFSTSMILHIAAAIIGVILAETIGLWFLNNKLVIAPERMVAANWVYQFAVFGFVLTILNAPRVALIISHEDMHIYGYMGIFDVIIRLATAYLLVIINTDKLIFYAGCGFTVTCLVWLFYFIYCQRKYKEAKLLFYYDKSLIKELSGIGGYTFLGTVFFFLSFQGVNIILNLFFGTAINAARGIAITVNIAFLSFGNNFKEAINPQLTKLYAAKDIENLWSLNERGTRLPYFLLLIFSIPLLLKAEFILWLWLGNVPEYAVIFAKIMIIDSLLGSLFTTLNTINYATKNIRAFQFVNYGYQLSVLMLSYLVCKIGYAPQYVFLVPLLVRPLGFIGDSLIMKRQVGFSIKYFARKALVPVFFVSIISFFPFYILNKILYAYESFWYSCAVILSSMLWTGLVVMLLGLRKNERVKIITFVKKKIGMGNKLEENCL